MRDRGIYRQFRQTVLAQGMGVGAVEMLSAADVRSMTAGGAEGMSVTFLGNMCRRLVAELRAKEDHAVAEWIESKIRERFPLAEVRLPERKVAVIYLAGVEEEE